MKKSDAKMRLVGNEVERLSYSVFDNKRWWGKGHVGDIEACFELSHTPSIYYPGYIGQLWGMLEFMQEHISDNHTEEEIAYLEGVLEKVEAFCEERDIEQK